MSQKQRTGTLTTTPPPASGMVGTRSQLTPLSKTRGKIALNCDQCDQGFERYACHAKRSSTHYCSTSCHDLARQVRIKVACEICGEEFEGVPTVVLADEVRGAPKKVTCSRKCLKEKRRRYLTNQAVAMDQSPVFNYGEHECGEQMSRKLSADAVEKIRSDTRTQRIIASEHGISQSMVSLIKTGRNWAA